MDDVPEYVPVEDISDQKDLRVDDFKFVDKGQTYLMNWWNKKRWILWRQQPEGNWLEVVDVPARSYMVGKLFVAKEKDEWKLYHIGSGGKFIPLKGKDK